MTENYEITHKIKFWTRKIPTRKNLGPMKYPLIKSWTHEIPTRKKLEPAKYPREKIWDPRIHKRKNFGSTKHPRRHDSTRPMQFSTLELMWVISKIIFSVSTLSEMCVISHAFVINVYSKTFLDLYTKDIIGSEILNIHVFFLYKQRSFFNSASVLLNNHHNHHCT